MPEVAGKEALFETPEDVAALYAWADLKGLKYHDFTAARKAYRAHLRERSAEAQRQAELRARAEAAVAKSSRGMQSSSADASEAQGRRAAAKDSMLPQRFPRRRQARDLAPRLPDGPEALTADAVSASGEARPLVRSVVSREDSFKEAGAEANPVRDESQGAEASRGGRQRRTYAEAAPIEGNATSVRGAGMGGRPDASAHLPAWLKEQPVPETERPAAVTQADRARNEASPVTDTLHHSRERVASRWYALRGVFDPAAPAMEPTQAHKRESGSPVLGLFSLAGGVGKTSLTAALGRALSGAGEKVLLADVTAHGLLPFYFGAKELRHGVVRKFLPPPGSMDAPISLVSYELNGGKQNAGDELSAELAQGRGDFDRVIVDLSPAGPWMAERLIASGGAMLVPVAPDMNSVIGLGAVERFFVALSEGAGRPVQPRYLLTQFDSSLPLHLDVREVMRQQLGERLLPFVIRRSPAVAEALAEGMTVIDYAPESGVADDYRSVAEWVRTLSAPAQTSPRNPRWSER